MSEDVLDYMSDNIIESTSEDVRPGLVQSRTEKRQNELAKKKEISDQLNRVKCKSRKEIEKQTLEMGLQNPINASNKGYAMLERMGFKPGSSLGKSETGLKEPIPLPINRNFREGLGVKAALQEMRIEKKKQRIEQKKNGPSVQDFRGRMSEQVREREAGIDLFKSQKSCYSLDTAAEVQLQPGVPYNLRASVLPAGSVCLSVSKKEGRLTKKMRRKMNKMKQKKNKVVANSLVMIDVNETTSPIVNVESEGNIQAIEASKELKPSSNVKAEVTLQIAEATIESQPRSNMDSGDNIQVTESIHQKNLKWINKGNESKLNLELAIIPLIYPEFSLTQEQSDEIHAILLDRIEQQKLKTSPSVVKPNFDSFLYNPRIKACLVKCLNKPTKSWLMNVVRQLRISNGLELTSVEFSSLSKRFGTVRIGMFLPGNPIKKNKILRRIQIQNPEVNVTKWTYVDTITKKTKNKKHKCTFMILMIPKSHLEILASLGNSLYFGFSKVNILQLQPTDDSEFISSYLESCLQRMQLEETHSLPLSSDSDEEYEFNEDFESLIEIQNESQSTTVVRNSLTGTAIQVDIN